MIRRPPRSTQSRSSAASDVYKRQLLVHEVGAVAAAALDEFFGRPREDSLTTLTENAVVTAFEESYVEDEDVLLGGVLKADPLMRVFEVGHDTTD